MAVGTVLLLLTSFNILVLLLMLMMTSLQHVVVVADPRSLWSRVSFTSAVGCLDHSCPLVSILRLPLPLLVRVLVAVAVVVAAIVGLLDLGGKGMVTMILIEDVSTSLLMIKNCRDKQTNTMSYTVLTETSKHK